MYVAVVEPSKIAQVPDLRRKVTSIEQLDQQVEAGLSKASPCVWQLTRCGSSDAAGHSVGHIPPQG